LELYGQLTPSEWLTLRLTGRPSNGLLPIIRRPTSTAAAIKPEITSTEAESLKLAYQLRVGVVLSRPPQITRDLHPFEKAFYFYQRRLNERLALPFTRYFYYKKDTPALIEFKRKIQERKTAARDIGSYDAYGNEGWNDEVLVGAPETEPDHQMEALLRDAQPDSESPTTDGQGPQPKSQEASIPRPMPRITEADKKGDQKSLNRLLQRSLYLLVQNPEGRWAFPSAPLEDREYLRQVRSPNAQKESHLLIVR
jgi:large subunit ribosomal protein L46